MSDTVNDDQIELPKPARFARDFFCERCGRRLSGCECTEGQMGDFWIEQEKENAKNDK